MVHVADGVQPIAVAVGALHEQGVVDVEPGARLEADGLEPDGARARRAARGHEHLVGGHGRLVVQPDHDLARAVALDQRRRRRRAAPMAPSSSEARRRPRRRRTAPCSPSRPLAGEHRDLGAEPGERRGHLDRDEAAPDDRESGRRLLHARRVAAGPRARLGEPGDRRDRRVGSRGHDDGMPCDERRLGAVGALDRHPSRSVEPTVAALEPDADAREPVGGTVVVPVGHPVIAPCAARRRRRAPRSRPRRRPARASPREARQRCEAASSRARTPSTSTRRRRVRARRAPRRGPPAFARSATFSPTGPAPMTTTSTSRSMPLPPTRPGAGHAWPPA